MPTPIEAALLGFLGGVTRAAVGILKMKKGEFKLVQLIVTLILSGVIGLFAGLFVLNDYRLTLLAGYAGTDFVEGLYKASKRRIFGL